MSDGAHAQEAETPVVKASMVPAAAPGGRGRARDRKPCQGNACTSPEREGGERDTSDGASGVAPGAARPFFLAIQANARRIPLADASVQCVVTSPPYWGLRSYSTSPQIWGGDDCAHEWGEWQEKRDVREETQTGKTRTTERFYGEPSRKFDGNHQKHTAGQFCQHCGAWRGEYGSEPTPELYVAHTVEIFREVRRVLRADGTLWLNLGDCYHNGDKGGYHKDRCPNSPLQQSNLGANFIGAANRRPHPQLKPKDLVGVPWLVAFALRADGWWLRDTIIWHKPNPMPSSVADRTTTAHEYVFLLTKNARYFYDADAIREPVTSTGGASFGKQKHDAAGTGQQSRKLADPTERNNPLGRNKRSVWTIATQSFHGAHFATFPIKLVTPCILAGTSEKGCCPSCGAPWKRVVERIDTGQRQKMADGWDTGDGGHGTVHRAGREKGKTDVPVMAKVTTHWLPSCKCPAHAPRPCIVYDSFGGAATTAVAAKRLGRSAIVTELNADYIAMGIRRYQEDKPKPEKRTRARASTLDLFSLAGGAA